MISFRILDLISRPLLEAELGVGLLDTDREYLGEIFDSLIDDECEIALSYDAGCLLIRIFDDEYLFSYPVALSEEADERRALESVRQYAVKEEIPLTLCDVPSECLEYIRSYFTDTEAIAEDEDATSFTVRVYSELTVDEIPYGRGEKIEITPLSDSDAVEYARLCRDEGTNIYWGYDFREDNPDPDDDFFINCAREELARGVAMSLAIRYEGKYAGEVLFYAPDLMGGADFAVRILPEYRGMGLASDALRVLCNIARVLSLKVLYSSIDKRNVASLNAFKRNFELVEETDTIYRFSLKL